MAIAGSIALGSEAIPASSSPNPYPIYKVTNATGITLMGFTIQNTANVPVAFTIFQDNIANAIYSATFAALQGPTQVILPGSLVQGEQILATANQGGVVQLEVDGLLNVQDVATQMLQNIVFMLAQLGLDIPNQSAMNAGSFTF